MKALEVLRDVSSSAAPTAVELEQPLGDQERDALDKAWSVSPGIIFEIHMDPADALIGRVYREWKRGCPSIIPVEKVRSLMNQKQLNEMQTTSLDGNIALTFEAPTLREVKTVYGYYTVLRILANAWGYCGNFEVESKAIPGTRVKMFSWHCGFDYADRALRLTMRSNLRNRQDFRWMASRGRITRGAMVTLMRQGWPAGEALDQALKGLRLGLGDRQTRWPIGVGQGNR